jgi:hypothetical protein
VLGAILPELIHLLIEDLSWCCPALMYQYIVGSGSHHKTIHGLMSAKANDPFHRKHAN